MTKSPTVVSLAVVGISFYFSRLHMIYTADAIAAVAGYAVSTGVFPFLFGAVVGTVGVSILGKGIIEGIKKYWWMPLSGSISALIPLAIFIWAMSQPNH